jgi:hypothetical protein
MAKRGPIIEYLDHLIEVSGYVSDLLWFPKSVKRTGDDKFVVVYGKDKLHKIEGPYTYVLSVLKEATYRFAFDHYMATRHQMKILNEPPNFLNYDLFKCCMKKKYPHFDVRIRDSFFIMLSDWSRSIKGDISVYEEFKLITEGSFYILLRLSAVFA